MELLVKDLLTLPPFDQCSVLNPPAGLTKTLNGITVMDILDMDKWNKQDEAIIIGKFFEDGFDPKLLSNLARRGCPCIITKDKFAPFITSEQIEAACSADLAILVMPDQYSWSELTNPVNEALIRRQRLIIQRNERLLEIVVRNILGNPQFSGMADAISPLLEGPVAFLSMTNERIDSSTNWNWGNTLKWLKETDQEPIVLGINDAGENIRSYGLPNKEKDLQAMVYPISHANYLVDKIVVILPMGVKRLRNDLRYCLQLLSETLKLKCKLYREAYRDRLEYKTLFFGRAVNEGQMPVSELIKFELAIGRNLDESYYLASASIEDKNALQKYHTTPNTPRIDTWIESTELGEIGVLSFEYNGMFHFLMPAGAISIDRQSQALLQELERCFATELVAIGISDPCKPNDLKDAYRQALEALSIALSLGAAQKIKRYGSLGLLRLISAEGNLEENVFYCELTKNYIQPIEQHDLQNNSSLIETLQVFIHTNQSVKETSRLLFIHPNTLRARLKRINELLDMDLSEADNMLNMQIALKFYSLVNKNKREA